MTLTNTPQGPVKDSTEKFWRLGESLHHRTVQQFTINKWWHTPLYSLYFMAIGLLFSGVSMIAFSKFPWDDSIFLEKLMTLLIASPHGFFGIRIIIVAVAAWTDPYALTLDGNGGLILQSLVRDQYTVVKAITTVVLAQKENGEECCDALCIRTKFSNGKLKLPRFAEREEFLKALKAVHPAIVIETV